MHHLHTHFLKNIIASFNINIKPPINTLTSTPFLFVPVVVNTQKKKNLETFDFGVLWIL